MCFSLHESFHLFRWKDGVELPKWSRKYRIELTREGRASLVVSSPKCDMAGMYECTAINGLGSTTSSARVEILNSSKPDSGADADTDDAPAAAAVEKKT